MKIYLIIDTTAGCIYKIANEKGLIDYANQAHFIEDCGKAETVADAIEILNTDMFHVETLNIQENEIFIQDIELE